MCALPASMPACLRACMHACMSCMHAVSLRRVFGRPPAIEDVLGRCVLAAGAPRVPVGARGVARRRGQLRSAQRERRRGLAGGLHPEGGCAEAVEDGERQQRHGRGVLGSDDGQPLEQILLVGVLTHTLRLRKVLRDGRLPTPPQEQRQAAWTDGAWGQVVWACGFGAQRPPRQLQRPDAAPLSARWCGASCPAGCLILRSDAVALVPPPAHEAACNNRPAGQPSHRSLSLQNADPGCEGERPVPERRSRTHGRDYPRRERGPQGASGRSLAFGEQYTQNLRSPANGRALAIAFSFSRALLAKFD